MSAYANVNLTLLDQNDNCPVFLDDYPDITIPVNISNATVISNISVVDVDSDENGYVTLSMKVEGDVSNSIFTLLDTGEILVTGDIQSGRYVIKLVASDNALQPCKTSQEFAVYVPFAPNYYSTTPVYTTEDSKTTTLEDNIITTRYVTTEKKREITTSQGITVKDVVTTRDLTTEQQHKIKTLKGTTGKDDLITLDVTEKQHNIISTQGPALNDITTSHSTTADTSPSRPTSQSHLTKIQQEHTSRDVTTDTTSPNQDAKSTAENIRSTPDLTEKIKGDCTTDADCNNGANCYIGVCACVCPYSGTTCDQVGQCFETSIRVIYLRSVFGDTEAQFSSELEDPSSEMFKDTYTMAKDAMETVAANSDVVKEIKIIRFRQGSLFMDMSLVAVDGQSEQQIKDEFTWALVATDNGNIKFDLKTIQVKEISKEEEESNVWIIIFIVASITFLGIFIICIAVCTMLILKMQARKKQLQDMAISRQGFIYRGEYKVESDYLRKQCKK